MEIIQLNNSWYNWNMGVEWIENKCYMQYIFLMLYFITKIKTNN